MKVSLRVRLCLHGGADATDTATSAVDLDTDRAIQDIIRGPLFDDVTILTIAYVFFFSHPSACTFLIVHHRHRLNTIIESTRVLVLDLGRVAEFDAPGVLLADPSSRFYGMALEAGLVGHGEQGQEEAK